MSISFKGLWRDYGVIGVVLLACAAYAMFLLAMNLRGSRYVSESMSDVQNNAYKNTGGEGVQPSNGPGADESYSSVQGLPSSTKSSCSSVQNPADLLPKDKNSSWADLNPSGKGDLANLNLLQAGYHIGIDTVGQSLRNANLQIRSEPPIPQMNTGIWNQSTITSDFMRPPLEIGQGGQ